MLSHRFTLIGLGLCLKTTRSYLTKLKQLLLALPPPPPLCPTPPSAHSPPPHSRLCVVSKPLALLQSGLYPPPAPVPMSRWAGGQLPPARLTSSGLTAPSTPQWGGAMGAGGRGRRRRGADGAHFLSGETMVRLAEHLAGFRSPLGGGGGGTGLRLVVTVTCSSSLAPLAYMQT